MTSSEEVGVKFLLAFSEQGGNIVNLDFILSFALKKFVGNDLSFIDISH